MTIDEAIKHCLEVTNEKSEQAELWKSKDEATISRYFKKCAADHRQLAEWLTDYKELKNSIGAVKLELLKEAQAELEKRGNMLHDAIAELEEAKRLLKSAAKIAKNLPCDDGNCSECVHNDNGYVCSEYEYFEWRFADAALKLIGEDEDVNT